MQDIVKIGLLFDFYGTLLTQRQQSIMNLYINDDFSLFEIAQKFEISRQGVHDTIKRATNKLEDFENKLGLWKKMKRNNNLADEAVQAAEKGNTKLAEEKIRLIVEG